MCLQILKYLLSITKIFIGLLQKTLSALYLQYRQRSSNYFLALLAMDKCKNKTQLNIITRKTKIIGSYCS